MLEVQAGQLAQERAQDPQIKQFGERLARDHQQANDELMQIAQTKGVQVPQQLSKEHQAMLDKLQKAQGAEFDRMFVQTLGRNEHGKDIKQFESAAKSKDPQIQAFAQKTLPTLREHRKEADRLASTVARSGSSPQGRSSKSSSPSSS